MKFNSIEFLLFLALAFQILWTLRKSLKAFNLVLLVFSYVFYGWWDYRFLILIAFSSLVDYTVGYYMPRSRHKKLLISLSLIINLGLLAFFKYFNFFLASAKDLFDSLGWQMNEVTLQIILPVGISFYTFQTLSYSLDVYKGKIKPETNLIAFLNYVSFFPQLVAGPIERATTFLPQFKKPKSFNYQQAVEGMRLLLYGFFKKMVIADNIGIQVDAVYGNVSAYNGITLYAATALFFVQLYTDFSAYTDIARGVAKLLGYELIRNFKTPLFAKSIPEFWSRWHISLTTWFRDYLFIGLARLNRNSTLWRITATIILFAVIGLWHGANYTFLIFGIIQGIAFIPRIMASKVKWIRKSLSYLNTHKVVSKFTMLANFLFLSFVGVFFRSEDIYMVNEIYQGIFNNFHYSIAPKLLEVSPLAIGILIFEWIFKDKSHPFHVTDFSPFWRRAIYVALVLSILLFGYFGKEPFYYFQF